MGPLTKRPQQVVLIRHGETAWSRDGKHTGRSDVPLTAQGRREAERLAPHLQGWDFSLVLSSPFQRALDTCRLAGLGDRAQLLDDLAEWNYGAYDGLTLSQIHKKRPGWFLWRDGGLDGETPGEVGRRADRVIAEIRRGNGDAALFAHGHILRVLAARWLGEAPASGRYYYLSPATISVLGYEHEDDPVIRIWNEAAAPEPAH